MTNWSRTRSSLGVVLLAATGGFRSAEASSGALSAPTAPTPVATQSAPSAPRVDSSPAPQAQTVPPAPTKPDDTGAWGVGVRDLVDDPYDPPSSYVAVKNRIESVPCDQVLQLGPADFLIRYTPPYRGRPYLLNVQRDIADHYKKCRVEGYRPLLAKLPREERRVVDGVRPRIQAYISTLYNLREQCSPRKDFAYDQREALALLRLEDLLARFVEQVTAPEGVQGPRCDTQDFAPVRAEATALINRPCPPPDDADEEDRLLHERSLNLAAPGFNVSTDDLKPYCEHFPRAAMQPLLVFAHELLLQEK